VTVGDLDIFYHEAGAGDPLVLLHGGLVTAAMMFAGRMEKLAGDYHVFAPDTRGHGRTGNPGGRLSYPQMADDVAGFIDVLGIERPHIAGYSDGGQIALEFGLRHPGKAKTLVLGGTISGPTRAYLETLHSWGFIEPGKVDEEQLERSFGDFFTTVKGAHGHAHGPDYWRSFLPQISELWLTVPNYSDERLKSITDPTLVIMGDRDGDDGLEHAIRLYKGIPKAELAIVPNSPHGAVERGVFWDIVRDFHRRHAA
jgi:pimeloyl-ACP methyl ester carboxylesterase